MGKVAIQTEARMVNVTEVVNQEAMERKISVLPREALYSHTGRYGRKRFGEESDDVIVGEPQGDIAEGLKRFIVRIAMVKIIHESEIGWTGKVGT